MKNENKDIRIDIAMKVMFLAKATEENNFLSMFNYTLELSHIALTLNSEDLAFYEEMMKNYNLLED